MLYNPLNVEFLLLEMPGVFLLTVRCGRRKTAEFIMRQMRGNTEAGDDGGFTPLLNAGEH